MLTFSTLLIRRNQVFSGPNSDNRYSSIQGQFDLFEHAHIIIGPHGAGLTNMIWSSNQTTVIEFSLTPYVNRNLGFLAVATEMDYWIVPQISTNLYLKYTIDDGHVAAVVRLVKHVIEKRGLKMQVMKDEL